MINILSKPDNLNYKNFYHFFVIAHRSEGAQEAPVKAQFQEKRCYIQRNKDKEQSKYLMGTVHVRSQ